MFLCLNNLVLDLCLPDDGITFSGFIVYLLNVPADTFALPVSQPPAASTTLNKVISPLFEDIGDLLERSSDCLLTVFGNGRITQKLDHHRGVFDAHARSSARETESAKLPLDSRGLSDWRNLPKGFDLVALTPVVR